MDAALHEGWPQMDQLKKEYRHCFHRRAKNGSIVYYDRLDFRYMSGVCDGVAGPKLTPDELIRYYMFTTDFVYAHLSKEDPGGNLTTVYDLSRFTLSSLLGSATDPIKRIIRLYSVHYPERQAKVFLINAPHFFSGLWSSIRPFLDPAVVDSISISSRGRATELLDYIGAENVPVEYGGTDTCPLGEAPEELQLRDWVVGNRQRRRGGGGGGADLIAPMVHLATTTTTTTTTTDAATSTGDWGIFDEGADFVESNEGEVAAPANNIIVSTTTTTATPPPPPPPSVPLSGPKQYRQLLMQRLHHGTLRAILRARIHARITSATLVGLVAIWVYSYLLCS